MKTRVPWLIAAAYIVGIVIDALEAFKLFLGFVESFSDPAQYGITIAYAMAFSLMVGWTVLLAWALFKPIERRGTLIITAVPVVVLIWALGFAAVVVYGKSFWDRWFELGGAPILVAVFIAAYALARRQAKEERTA